MSHMFPIEDSFANELVIEEKLPSNAVFAVFAGATSSLSGIYLKKSEVDAISAKMGSNMSYHVVQSVEDAKKMLTLGGVVDPRYFLRSLFNLWITFINTISLGYDRGSIHVLLPLLFTTTAFICALCDSVVWTCKQGALYQVILIYVIFCLDRQAPCAAQTSNPSVSPPVGTLMPGMREVTVSSPVFAPDSVQEISSRHAGLCDFQSGVAMSYEKHVVIQLFNTVVKPTNDEVTSRVAAFSTALYDFLVKHSVYLDTCASHSIFSSKEYFVSWDALDHMVTVRTSNGEFTQRMKTGTVRIPFLTDGGVTMFRTRAHVYYCPSVGKNLLSQSDLISMGVDTHLLGGVVPGSSSYCVCKEGRLRLELSHGTFRLVMPRSVISKWARVPIAHMMAYDTLISKSKIVKPVSNSNASSDKKHVQSKAVKPIPVDSVVVPREMGTSEQNWRTWAARTCGASAYVLSKLSVNTAGSKDCPTEIPKGYSNTNWFDAGVLGKMRKTPSLPKENKATRFREFISMDYLVMNQPSVRGHRYALNIVDHFSGVPKSYTCKTRDEVQYYILQYLAIRNTCVGN